MFKQKRFLVKRAFEKAENELPRGSKSSLATYLSSLIEEKYNYKRDERTYSRYYTNLVEGNSNYKMEELSLYYLSKYLSYENFEDFCEKEKELIDADDPENNSTLTEILMTLISIKNIISYAISHITTKKSSLGFLGIITVFGFFLGKKVIADEPIIADKPPISLLYSPCMYWDNIQYKVADCNNKNPQRKLIPIDSVKLKYFKKITRKDTITIKSAWKIWYSKYQNEVDFFTMEGRNPENNIGLKPASEYMIEKYAGK